MIKNSSPKSASPLRRVSRYMPIPYLEVGAMLLLALAAAHFG